MQFRRFYDDGLAQASYFIGCQATGEAVVVDPNRDIEPYLAFAAREGMRIVAVTETHIHADFVSGARELATRTGARMHLSDAGPEEWRYRFRDDPGFVPLTDGSSIVLGKITLRAVHTPGHTPEHLSFLVTDGAASADPMGILTGDFVFVGDVGRPDLLEKAARVEGASEGSARELFRSLAWFRTLPDHLQVWPGHGAGSACGKGIGSVPSSTVGYEKRTNWALGLEDEEAFVAAVLFGQPEPPAYFGVMKRVNRDGPRVLGGLPVPMALGPERLADLVMGGATAVDTRPAVEFAAGHLPGTVSIPWNRSFATYAGSLLPYDEDLHLVAADEATLREAARALVLIGLDRLAGWFPADQALGASGQALTRLPAVRPDEAIRRMDEGAVLVDVRGESEWRAGHVEGAALLPLPELIRRLDEIPADRPVLLHCQTGARSAIATSLLRARGRQNVTNVAGGFAAWPAARVSAPATG